MFSLRLYSLIAGSGRVYNLKVGYKHLEMNTGSSVSTPDKIKLAYQVSLPPFEDEKTYPPVILLHGFIESKTTWRNIAPAIARNTGRKVYALDLRNHGESPWTEEFDFDVMAQDVENFMDDHGILRATLIGHSAGARAAMTLALKKPRLIEKLIIEDMTPRKIYVGQHSFILKGLELCKEWPKWISTSLSEEKVKEILFNVISSSSTLKKRMKVQKFLNAYTIATAPLKIVDDMYEFQANLEAIAKLLKSEKMQQELTGLYSGPALFLKGSKPFFDIENDELMTKLFPCINLKKIEGASHFIHIEYPEEFLQCVTSFINRVSQGLSKY